jgi:hypothetical protein
MSRCVVVLLGVFFSCAGLFSSSAQANTEAVCVRWFKKKHYQMAAKCFKQLVTAIESKGKPNEAQRIQMGGWLRNAALAYQKAAGVEKKPQRQSYLRELALQQLKHYLSGQFAATKTQQRIVKGMSETLQEKIGYANLTVLSGEPNARVQVIGYKFSKKLTGGGVLSVRPGEYTILVVFPNKKQDARTISVSSGKPTIVRFQTAVPKREVKVVVRKRAPAPRPKAPTKSTNVVPVVLMAVGGAVVLAGGALVAGGLLTNGTAEKTLQNAISLDAPGQTKKAGEQQALAGGLYYGGWGVLGGGVGIAAVGLIIQLASGGNAKKK